MSSLEEYLNLIMGKAKRSRDYIFLSCFCSSQASFLHVCTRAVICFALQVQQMIVFILGHAKHTGQFISMFFLVDHFNK